MKTTRRAAWRVPHQVDETFDPYAFPTSSAILEKWSGGGQSSAFRMRAAGAREPNRRVLWVTIPPEFMGPTLTHFDGKTGTVAIGAGQKRFYLVDLHAGMT